MKKLIFSLTLVGLAYLTPVRQVIAQSPVQPKPSPTVASRERRSSTSSNGSPDSTASTSSGAPKDSTKAETPKSPNATSAVKSTDLNEASKAAEARETTPTDPISELRAQIGGAETSQQRVSLQLKLVDLLADAGKRNEALEELHKITASDEFNPQGYFNTGNAFARLGETDSAIAAYRKALDQKNGLYSKAYNNMGVLLLRIGRWDEAYEAFISALKLENFHYAEASYNLGRLYAARGENDLAIREWKRTLTIDQHHEAAAQALSHIGNEGSVVVTAAKVKTEDTSKSKSKNNSVNSSTNVESKSVVNHSASTTENPSVSSPSPKVFTIDSTSYEFLQRARSSSERGKTQEAINQYQQVISRQGGYFPPANLELSYLLLTAKRYDEAQTNLLKVSNRDGKQYPISYFHLARLYELKNELPLAEAAFTQAYELYGPRNSQVLLDLSRVREKQGNFKGALEAMERYLSIIESQGQHVSWSDERLSELRQKSSTTTPK